MGKIIGTIRILTFLLTAVLCLPGCRRGPGASYPKSMRLTSDYTEIVVYSTRVPGYWSGKPSDPNTFFLYTQDRSYKKGDLLEFDGTFGTAPASVFDDETRVYRSGQMTNIYVVWRARASAVRSAQHPAPKGVPLP